MVRLAEETEHGESESGLEEVLAKMVQDGVLKATRTVKGALVYSPGPNYEQYRQPNA